MLKPGGDIIEKPFLSNFREGLSVPEYFISCHGVRKEVNDRARQTDDAGYLTRKLVSVAKMSSSGKRIAVRLTGFGFR